MSTRENICLIARAPFSVEETYKCDCMVKSAIHLLASTVLKEVIL